ncbi:hypothetical protein QEP73_00990 [Pseudomonas defluvii]|nr:hypothetical protein QEP73_00990 [Pseudomonas defluvii]
MIIPSNDDRALPLSNLGFVAIPIPQEMISKHGRMEWKVIDLEKMTRIKNSEEEISFSFARIEEKPEFIGMNLKDLGYKFSTPEPHDDSKH